MVGPLAAGSPGSPERAIRFTAFGRDHVAGAVAVHASLPGPPLPRAPPTSFSSAFEGEPSAVDDPARRFPGRRGRRRRARRRCSSPEWILSARRLRPRRRPGCRPKTFRACVVFTTVSPITPPIWAPSASTKTPELKLPSFGRPSRSVRPGRSSRPCRERTAVFEPSTRSIPASSPVDRPGREICDVVRFDGEHIRSARRRREADNFGARCRRRRTSVGAVALRRFRPLDRLPADGDRQRDGRSAASVAVEHAPDRTRLRRRGSLVVRRFDRASQRAFRRFPDFADRPGAVFGASPVLSTTKVRR